MRLVECVSSLVALGIPRLQSDTVFDASVSHSSSTPRSVDAPLDPCRAVIYYNDVMCYVRLWISCLG